VDKAAEDAILARLRDLDVTIVSEEAGRIGGGSTVVVVDPIDGSLNAKRGIPFFSVSIAVADGERMGDVHFGYVYDFGSGEEWVARRGEGATLDGERLHVLPKDRIEILSFEATPHVVDRARTRRRSWTSRTASGSWGRSRSRSATSQPAASTPSAR